MQETLSYVLSLVLFALPIVGLIWLGAWVIKIVFLHQALVIGAPFG